MGLDVLLYDDENKLVSTLEMKEEFHDEIFTFHKRWTSYLYLRKLNDYYLTNEEFSGEALKGLINDLINYKPLLSAKNQETVQLLLDAISNKKVQKIRITGD